MPEERNVPQIRFKGFTDPWEQCELGHLGHAQSGFGFPEVEQGGTRGLPFFKVSDMNIEGNETELRGCKNYVTPGQIVKNRWQPIMDVPAIFFAKVGAAVMLERKRLVTEPFLLDNNTMAFSLAGRVHVRFAQALFSGIKLTSLIQIGALPSFNAADLEGLTVRVPTDINEQRSIGELLHAVDRLIALHQRKLDKLTNVKKSLLEKMFPKPGSDVPEIRFAGFTAPWEQRQLGEVCTFRKGQGYSKADVSDKGTPILLYGRLYTHYQTCIRGIDTYADERADSVISRGGEVLVPASGESAEEIAVAASLDRPGVILGGDLNVATPSGVLKPEFLAYGITYGPAHQDLAMRAQGKSVVHVHNSDIAEVQICYPVPDEQNLFSTLFIRLDSLIALHQRKLDMLENVKKSLLEKMFV